MSDETEPGRTARDLELQRRWREQFEELPSTEADTRIRAAAHATRDAAMQARRRVSNHRQRWFRIAPLAAAASVALLAVGLVRLIPQDEYAAIPMHSTGQEYGAKAPAAASESTDTVAQTPLPSGPSPDIGVQGTPAFTPDAPPVAIVPPEERASPPLEAQARDSAAAAPAATASPPTPSPTAQEAARAARAPADVRGGGALLHAPTAAITNESNSDVPVAKAAGALASPPTPPTAAVLADAARRTGTEVNEVRIVDVTPVTWRDASLGCGETDADESHALGVPGFVIAVEARGMMLRYHTDAADQLRVCE